MGIFFPANASCEYQHALTWSHYPYLDQGGAGRTVVSLAE